MSTTISFLGFLTHDTMWFLERIITPSINACPPNANDGSFFSLFDNPSPHSESQRILMSLNARRRDINVANKNQKLRNIQPEVDYQKNPEII